MGLVYENKGKATKENISAMGNDVSSNVAMAGAKSKFDATMADINNQLGNTSQKDEKVGCASKKESRDRRAQREADYKMKQAARAERKAHLAQQWAANKQKNSP